MKLYVVQWVRALFEVIYSDIEIDSRTQQGLALPPRMVCAFNRRVDAERLRSQYEAARNPPVAINNPFHMTDGNEMSTITSMPEEILRDWVQEAGLQPPPSEPTRPRESREVRDKWGGWWSSSCASMTERKRAHVYCALDKLDFLEIVELELEE